MPDDSPPTPPLPSSDDETAILGEFERLIMRGHEILHACGWDGKEYIAFKPGGVEVLKFRSQALSLVRRACDEGGKYDRQLTEYAEDRQAARQGYHVKEFLDVLESAYRERQREQLFSVPASLLTALGDDLIELAEVMSNAGCQPPAATLAGAMLQRVLQRLGQGRGIPDAEDLPPDDLNDELLRAGVYDGAVHRKVGACLQITRDLGQPRGESIPEIELIEMVNWVRDFALQHRHATTEARRTQPKQS